ncbi:MAG: transcription elongation factor GreA [Thermodesulfobacteriota bacterium]
MERVPMTPKGHKKLQDELKRLKTVERQEVIKLIEYARSLGDLSENAEYETAKQRQSFVEGRIQELESKLSRAEVIDPATLEEVMMQGNLRCNGEARKSRYGETVAYQLVGPDESEPENGMISITSPIGRALIGKSTDDEVTVNAPGGVREFIILEIY